MRDPEPFVDLHCHLLPGLDDGASGWNETLAMARIAVEDGIRTIILTPHQLGLFSANASETIRLRLKETQRFLEEQNVPLTLLAGAELRVESDLLARLMRGQVLSLGDHRKHVLVELPAEYYLPLDLLLEELAAKGIVAVLAHPERNRDILANPRLAADLVDQGCLLQVTAGSLTGAFGPDVQRTAEWLVRQGLVHCVATDAHGSRVREPRLRPAFARLVELADWSTAIDLCCRTPATIAAGKDIAPGRRRVKSAPLRQWFGLRRAA